MDNHIGKRASAEHVLSRRGSTITVRDAEHNGKSSQYCNRLGCSTRHNYLKSAQTGTQEKPKLAKPSLRPIRGKEKAESSSRTISTASSYRRSFQDQQNPTSLGQSATVESNSRQEDNEYLPSRHRRSFMQEFKSNVQQDDNEDSGSTSTSMECLESIVADEISSDATQPPIHFSAASSSIPTYLNIGRQDAPSSSRVQRPSTAYHGFSHATKPVALGWGSGSGTQSSTLKSLRCTSISDVLPSGCSSSGYSRDTAIDIARRKVPNGENSTRSKPVNALSGSGSTRPIASRSRLSIPERVVSEPVSRRTRDRPAARDSPVSVRTRRSSNAESRMMLSLRGNDSILDETIMTPQVPCSQLPIPEVTPANSSRSFTMDMPHSFNSTSGRPGSSHRSGRSRSDPHPEDQDNDLQIFNGSIGNRDGHRRFNMEGVAEMLLALERIEQDEELSYEQLLVLETSLFLGGLSFHDQHRDMRLDIDNMSYEELLALEEKMGNVTTALSEEQLFICVNRSIYELAVMFPGTSTGDVDDVKCSICQEEYVDGDELGNLPCKHRYHVPCIHHWLRQKNWCPICKSCTLPS